MKERKDFKFDKRASAYDDGFEGKLSKRFYKLLLNQIDLFQGAAVLDVGCGTGTILNSLSKQCNISGCGIDVEENMITAAKAKCPDMDIRVSSCMDTPFHDKQFDVITACMAYHHFADKDGFAKEASRIIKPGGCLYIADPHFPAIIRKPLNLTLKVHKIAGFFGTPVETERLFQAYGFKLVGFKYDRYAQCIKLLRA